jgi:2-keto-4-pentenoate hydratase/2-oxohepta-3-ene-1,7-dioic acid hydratase in catechol pathway
MADAVTTPTEQPERGVAATPVPPPTKVIAVHLNYRSRAAERGRTPAEPSYFLKPPSSLSAGGELIQPQGTELLAYEGEVAIIIKRGGRDIDPEQAAAHIGWYAAANDFGVHDFRWADRGSNFMAKGQDGFTPIGPRMDATGINPSTLRLRTYVNGELRQDTEGDELLFAPAQLVADLSRFVTLEPGDVILAGTPTGTGVVRTGDVVEVSLDGAGSVTSTIVESPRPLRPYGAMPKATPTARAYATGGDVPRPHELSDDAKQILRAASGLCVRICAWSATHTRCAMRRSAPTSATQAAVRRTPRSARSRACSPMTC